MGFGSIEGQISVANVDECAGKCNYNIECLSFEFSPSKKMCNLNKEAEPNWAFGFEDYLLCGKDPTSKIINNVKTYYNCCCFLIISKR